MSLKADYREQQQRMADDHPGAASHPLFEHAGHPCLPGFEGQRRARIVQLELLPQAREAAGLKRESMGERVTAFRVTCTQGYDVEQVGTRLSWWPWGWDNLRKGYNEPIKVEVLFGLHRAVGFEGQPMWAGNQGRFIELPEALDLGYARVV